MFDNNSVPLWLKVLEDHTVAEIAFLVGRSERTVRRKLAAILDCWQAEGLA